MRVSLLTRRRRVGLGEPVALLQIRAEQLERAVQETRFPTLVTRVTLAHCLGAAGRYAEAETHLRQALNLDPDFAIAWISLANLFVARSMFAEALPFCREGLFPGSLVPDYHRWLRGTVAFASCER